MKRGSVVPSDAALPPAPPGVRYVRVPRYGVVIADDELRHRVDRFFHTPMIVLGLLTLPLLALDVLFIREPGQADDPVDKGALFWLIIGGLTLIWIAFTAEFVIKVSIAESRVEYVRRNWLDIIIILIPVLRPLRAASVMRTTRVFTLRGVGFKIARYVFTLFVGMEASDRLMRRLGLKNVSGRKDPAAMTRHELMTELRRLRARTDAWEAWYAQHRDFLESCRYSGQDGGSLPPPPEPELESEPELHAEAESEAETKQANTEHAQKASRTNRAADQNAAAAAPSPGQVDLDASGAA